MNIFESWQEKIFLENFEEFPSHIKIISAKVIFTENVPSSEECLLARFQKN